MKIYSISSLRYQTVIYHKDPFFTKKAEDHEQSRRGNVNRGISLVAGFGTCITANLPGIFKMTNRSR